MFDEMVFYHDILVKILLGLLVVGMLIPFFGRDSIKSIRRIRIYMFVFHGFITTVAFSGLVAFVFGKMSFDLSILAMIVVYIFLTVLESIKYLKILKLYKNSSNSIKDIRSINIKYSLINILIVTSLIIWKIVEHSSAVPLS